MSTTNGGPHRGRFRPVAEVGPDPRRHVFTESDCRVGYLVAAIKHPHLRDWLRRKVRCHARAKGTSDGPQEKDR